MRCILVVCVVLLSGCQTKPLSALSYAEQQEMIQTLLERCYAQGVKPDTQAEMDCFAQEVRAEQYQRDQNAEMQERTRVAFQEMARNQAMINAAQASNRVNCASTRFGNQIQTNCY